MAMTPLPPLDPSSPTFRADVDAFFRTRMPAFVSEANAMQGNLNSIAAGGAYAIPFVGWAEPATVKDGFGRLSIPGTQDQVPNIFFNPSDLSVGNARGPIEDMFSANSIGTNRGYIKLVAVKEPTRWITYRVTGYTFDSVNYRCVLGVTFISSSGPNPIQANEAILMQCTRTGDRGDSGVIGTAIIRDQVASGQSAQAVSVNVWNARRFNTMVVNDIPGLVLGQRNGVSIITIPAGKYWFSARASMYGFAAHNLRLFNVTNNSTHDVGGNENPAQTSGGAVQSSSTAELQTFINFPSAAEFRLDHFAAAYATGASQTGGVPVNNGTAEVYAEVKITRIG